MTEYDENINLEESQFAQEVLSKLTTKIPDTPKYDIPDNIPATKKITGANEKAKQALVNSFNKSEKSRIDLQKPLFFVVLGSFAVQLLAFNIIIGVLVFRGTGNIEVTKINLDVFSELLNFLRYYIGAVVVEIIGLTTIIVKNAFSLHSNQMMSKLLDNEK